MIMSRGFHGGGFGRGWSGGFGRGFGFGGFGGPFIGGFAGSLLGSALFPGYGFGGGYGGYRRYPVQQLTFHISAYSHISSFNSSPIRINHTGITDLTKR